MHAWVHMEWLICLVFLYSSIAVLLALSYLTDCSSGTIHHHCMAQRARTSDTQGEPFRNVTLLAFIPCKPSTAYIEDCHQQSTFVDTFVYYAIETAVEYVNGAQGYRLFCSGNSELQEFRVNLSVEYIEYKVLFHWSGNVFMHRDHFTAVDPFTAFHCSGTFQGMHFTAVEPFKACISLQWNLS